MNIFYVYAYIRAKDSITAKAGTPYYIGKGKGNRAYDKHRCGIPVPKDRKFIVILEKGLFEIGSLAIERRMIEWYGRKNLKTGILINLTDGGDGVSGSITSDEVKKKLSLANSGELNPNFGRTGDKHPLFGKSISEATRARMQGIRGKRKPQEQKTCPHCGLTGFAVNMSRYHFENCLTKTNIQHKKHTDATKEKMRGIRDQRKPQQQLTCPHCDMTGAAVNLVRYHFDKCKHFNTASTSEIQFVPSGQNMNSLQLS